MKLTNFIPEMSQKKPKMPEYKKQKSKIISEVERQNNIWIDVNKFTDKCKANKDNFAYIVVELKIQSTLNERKEWLYITSAFERLFKDDKDSYGGSWGIEDVEDINGFYQDVLDFKRNLCNVPYKKKIIENFILTDVHSDNIMVFFRNGAEEYLESNGIDVNKLKADWENIKSKPATDEDIKRAERYYFIQKEINRLKGYKGIIREIDTAIKAKVGIKGEYGTNIPACPLKYVDTTISSLLEIKKNTSEKLKKLKAEKGNMKNNVNNYDFP